MIPSNEDIAKALDAIEIKADEMTDALAVLGRVPEDDFRYALLMDARRQLDSKRQHLMSYSRIHQHRFRELVERLNVVQQDADLNDLQK